MKKTISTWWPLAVLLLLALTFYTHSGAPAHALKKHQETTVSGVSAELARAISYGLVSDESTAHAMPDAPNAL
jgi:hypothetical protein